MTAAVTCADLDLFIDGELGEGQARAFRDHLGICRECPARLRATILSDDVARVALAGTRPRTLEFEAQDTMDEPAGPAQAARESASSPAALAMIDQLALRRRRRLTVVAATLTCAVAAAAALLIVRRPALPPDLLAVLGEESHRSIDGRLAYPGMDRHRPLARERGGLGVGAPRLDREQVLAGLEQMKDQHGLGVALLLEGRPAQAERQLAEAATSAAVHSDAAAAALERGDAQAALARADRALALQAQKPQALWNRAVALEMLGRWPEAASAFAAVAALSEPGWSQEARAREATLRARHDRRPGQ